MNLATETASGRLQNIPWIAEEYSIKKGVTLDWDDKG